LSEETFSATENRVQETALMGALLPWSHTKGGYRGPDCLLPNRHQHRAWPPVRRYRADPVYGVPWRVLVFFKISLPCRTFTLRSRSQWHWRSLVPSSVNAWSGPWLRD